MSSAILFDLDPSKILSTGNGLVKEITLNRLENTGKGENAGN